MEKLKKKILVSGVAGQDGSWMVDYLLINTDCEIYGMLKRSATPNYKNMSTFIGNPRFHMVFGDLSDGYSIDRLVKEIQPDYFINFAADSFVATSWSAPEHIFDVNTLGVLRCLEAIRKNAPECRFYSSGSSEEFGDVSYSPQDEKHPLKPRSPYGASKASARHMVKVYRESYNLYAIQGWLFNHECLTAKTPVILKNKYSKLIDIKPISEIVPHRTDPIKGHNKKFTTIIPCDWLLWDGEKWSEIKTRTATWNGGKSDKIIYRINSRGGLYEASASHKSFKKGKIETFTENLKTGDELELKDFPDLTEKNEITEAEAEFLGLMVAEGHFDKKRFAGRFTNKDRDLHKKIIELWNKLSVGYTSQYFSVSGFTNNKDILNTDLFGDANYCKYILPQIYTKDGEKRVPQRILNSSKSIILAFLRGYNQGDGLKAGRQKTEFKSFTTSSYCLAAGLWYLLNKLGYRVISCPEERNDSLYFHLNINSNNNYSKKGKHFIKNLNEITKITKLNYKGWLFDLETDSKTFSAGVGLTWVHNSEGRRGEEFVTRKITKGVARIYHAIKNNQSFEPIELGNLDAKRDWSHALDFCDAIWKMLNQESYCSVAFNESWQKKYPYIQNFVGLVSDKIFGWTPKEYVVASGETHSIREFIELAFSKASIGGGWVGSELEERFVTLSRKSKNLNDTITLVKINPKFYRPAEVSLLMGNSAKITDELGWKPKIDFNMLVGFMVEWDIKNYE